MQGSFYPRQPQSGYAVRVAALMLAGCIAAAPACAAGAHGRGGTGSAHGSTQRAQGYLGIAFRDVSPGEAVSLHLETPHGAEVIMVDHDGPAGKAGLRAHDVIVAVNGQVVDRATTLRRQIHEAGAGMAIALQVLRDGSCILLHARLGDRQKIAEQAMESLEASAAAPEPGTGLAEADSYANEPPPARPLPPEPPSRAEEFLSAMLHGSPFTGLALEAMPPQLASFFGAPKGQGLLVGTVTPNSPGSVAGLRAGDILLRADNVPLHTLGEWTRHLRAVRGHPVKLTLLRDKHQQTVTLVPDLKRHSELRLPDRGVAA